MLADGEADRVARARDGEREHDELRANIRIKRAAQIHGINVALTAIAPLSTAPNAEALSAGRRSVCVYAYAVARHRGQRSAVWSAAGSSVCAERNAAVAFSAAAVTTGARIARIFGTTWLFAVSAFRAPSEMTSIADAGS